MPDASIISASLITAPSNTGAIFFIFPFSIKISAVNASFSTALWMFPCFINKY